MGAVTFSIDVGLVRCLKAALSLPVFVETGTFEGETVARVAPLFDEIHTVELVEASYQRACERFRDLPAVHANHGSSPAFLRALRPRLQGRSVLYWLDAHWCNTGDSPGGMSQCPLLEELEAIGRLNADSVILIDDARLFQAPPPPPHQAAGWPGLHAVIHQLFALSPEHEILIVNDVILFAPSRVRGQLHAYASEHGLDWLLALHKAQQYDELLRQVQEKEAVIRALDAAAKLQAMLPRRQATLPRRVWGVLSRSAERLLKPMSIGR